MEFYIRAIVEEKVDSPKMPPYLEAFPTNRAAMTVNKGWLVGTFTNQFPDLEFGVFPTPLAADRPDDGWWGIADDLGFGYTVNQFADDDEKEAANALLRYLYGDDEFMGRWAVNSAAVPSKLAVTRMAGVPGAKDSDIHAYGSLPGAVRRRGVPAAAGDCEDGAGVAAAGYVDR